MIVKDSKFSAILTSDKTKRLAIYFTFFVFIFTTAPIDSSFSAEKSAPEMSESSPVLFPSSYVGLLVNQNHPYSFGKNEYSAGGPSWGAEYRFFYKDNWTLAITGAFKQLIDNDDIGAPIFALSQETSRLVRLYHPWYFAAGARLHYFVPVRRIMLPYERDQTRAIDNGAAITLATIWKSSEKTALMFGLNRWRSLSTSKKQGIEISISALLTIR